MELCPLTLKELNTVAESFRFTLQKMLHSRIAYPAENLAGREQGARRPVDAPPVSAA